MQAKDLKVGDKINVNGQSLIISDVLVQSYIDTVFVSINGKETLKLSLGDEVETSQYGKMKAHGLISGQGILIEDNFGNLQVTRIIKIENSGDNVILFLWNGDKISVHKNNKSLVVADKTYKW